MGISNPPFAWKLLSFYPLNLCKMGFKNSFYVIKSLELNKIIYVKYFTFDGERAFVKAWLLL